MSLVVTLHGHARELVELALGVEHVHVHAQHPPHAAGAALHRLVVERDAARQQRRARDRVAVPHPPHEGAVPVREVLSSLVRRGTVSSWYLIARRVLQYQITIY